MIVPEDAANNLTFDVDPHVWLDPIIAQKIVEKISYQFEKLDSSNRKIFHKRRDELLNKLQV